MSNYKPTSWGRTRRPKHLSESVPNPRQSATTVTAVAVADLANGLDGTNAGENGYPTENQRFLHLLVKGGNNKSVTVYGYNYAFAEWAQIFVMDGSSQYRELSGQTGTGGEANLFVFKIEGVDRVAFVSADAPTTIRAACSTF